MTDLTIGIRQFMTIFQLPLDEYNILSKWKQKIVKKTFQREFSRILLLLNTKKTIDKAQNRQSIGQKSSLLMGVFAQFDPFWRNQFIKYLVYC